MRTKIFLAIILTNLLVGSVVSAHDELTAYPIITKGNIITSASEIGYPPFCIVDENGNAYGFSVELLRATLKAVNLGVSFKTGPWNEVKKSLEDGEVRVLPLVGRTPEREALFDFTVPYFSLKGHIYVRSDIIDIKNQSDLKGKALVVMKGDNAEEFIRREDLSSNITTTNTFEEAFRLINEGTYEATVTQESVGDEIIKKNGLSNIIKLDVPLVGFTQNFSFAVRENDKELLERLNEGLSIVMADGTYEKLKDKWFPPEEQPAQIKIRDLIRYLGFVGIPLVMILAIIIMITLRIQVKNKT